MFYGVNKTIVQGASYSMAICTLHVVYTFPHMSYNLYQSLVVSQIFNIMSLQNMPTYVC